MATKARVTAEDFWRMPSTEMHQELVNGEIIEMPPPKSFLDHLECGEKSDK